MAVIMFILFCFFASKKCSL